MELSRFFFVMAILSFALSFIIPSINAQLPVPVPAPAPAPASDGVAIDQGIAYVLLLVALAITYIMH